MHEQNKITKKLCKNQVKRMGLHIEDNKLVTISKPKTYHFDLPKNIDNNLQYEIDSVIKHNEFLPEHAMTKKRD